MNDRLEPLMHRRVIYTVTDQDGIYTGTVERDSNGRAYVQDDNGICVLYDTGILATVEEEDMTDHKRYLDEQYKIAVLDYKCAHTEDEQWDARKRMAQMEHTASEIYGFEYADSLHRKYLGKK